VLRGVPLCRLGKYLPSVAWI